LLERHISFAAEHVFVIIFTWSITTFVRLPTEVGIKFITWTLIKSTNSRRSYSKGIQWWPGYLLRWFMHS